MSLEVFGDEGPSETSSEDLEQAGYSSNPDGTIWWKYEGEEMSFEDACSHLDDNRQTFLEDKGYSGYYDE